MNSEKSAAELVSDPQRAGLSEILSQESGFSDILSQESGFSDILSQESEPEPKEFKKPGADR